MIKDREIIIGDVKYTIQAVDSRKGLKHFIAITKMVGGALGGLNAEDMGKTKIAEMANALINIIDDEKAANLIWEMIELSVKIPKISDMDLHFRGKYSEMLKLFIQILILNYAELVDYLKKKIPGKFTEIIQTIPAQENTKSAS